MLVARESGHVTSWGPMSLWRVSPQARYDSTPRRDIRAVNKARIGLGSGKAFIKKIIPKYGPPLFRVVRDTPYHKSHRAFQMPKN